MIDLQQGFTFKFQRGKILYFSLFGEGPFLPERNLNKNHIECSISKLLVGEESNQRFQVSPNATLQNLKLARFLSINPKSKPSNSHLSPELPYRHQVSEKSIRTPLYLHMIPTTTNPHYRQTKKKGTESFPADQDTIM